MGSASAFGPSGAEDPDEQGTGPGPGPVRAGAGSGRGGGGGEARVRVLALQRSAGGPRHDPRSRARAGGRARGGGARTLPPPSPSEVAGGPPPGPSPPRRRTSEAAAAIASPRGGGRDGDDGRDGEGGRGERSSLHGLRADRRDGPTAAAGPSSPANGPGDGVNAGVGIAGGAAVTVEGGADERPASTAGERERARAGAGGKGIDDDTWEGYTSRCESEMKDVALDGLRLLRCGSLDAFRDLFLADGAPSPLGEYMTDKIGDVNVRTSPWTAEECGVAVVGEEADDDERDDGGGAARWEARCLEFRHPLNSAFGPSHVDSRKLQRMRKFDDGDGLCLESATTISGNVPGAGLFCVSERWTVEPLPSGGGKTLGETTRAGGGDGDEGGVALTVRFRVDFDPPGGINGMLRKVIGSRARAETRDWYKGYADHMRDALEREGRYPPPAPIATGGGG